MKMAWVIESPLGGIVVAQDDESITMMRFGSAPPAGFTLEQTPLIKAAAQQLSEYFSGKRKEFTLPLLFCGTQFQMTVWNELTTIPYGQTRTYGDIAQSLGNPKLARAVGGACNKNPIIIVNPCHRVIGSNQSLRGYAGGMEAKKFLLNLEQ